MGIFARFFLVFAVLLAAAGASFSADLAEADYSKPPSWWPKGIKYVFPPAMKAPKGWKGKWPPDQERGHDLSFWTEYYKLKPFGPKKFGKAGDPEAPFANGFAGDARFVTGFPNYRRQKFCAPFKFAAKSKPKLVNGICLSGMMYPTRQVAAQCKSLVSNKEIDRFCTNQCAAKTALVGLDGLCRGAVVRPPASWLWNCADKEAGVLITCEVQFICDCFG